MVGNPQIEMHHWKTNFKWKLDWDVVSSSIIQNCLSVAMCGGSTVRSVFIELKCKLEEELKWNRRYEVEGTESGVVLVDLF